MNKVATNNQVVVANVLNMYVKKCEQTVDCWLKEADKRERKQMQKELAGRKNEKCESLSVCVSAPPEPTNPQYVCVSPHENAVRSAPPEYKTHIYPVARLDALKFDPTSTVLRQDNRSRTHKHEQREKQNERHERQRKQRRQRKQHRQRRRRKKS